MCCLHIKMLVNSLEELTSVSYLFMFLQTVKASINHQNHPRRASHGSIDIKGFLKMVFKNI
ncbi:MAG: hypothetical protein K0R71_364 [Bacillales bacterium]|nr:hypothetical protein [Bacillales bacterium]